MKNWLLALSGLLVRAMEQVPRTCGFGVEFLLQVRLVRATHTGALRAAYLRHEPIDHAVKYDAVIKPFNARVP